MSDAGLEVAGIAELADRYDAFLVDQFGVLHDGRSAYPGAIDALVRLKETGKPIGLVSNSGKRAAPNIARLAGLGFAETSYDAFISSGEVAWSLMTSGRIPVPAGGKCLQFSRGDDTSTLQSLGLTATKSGQDCDIVLIAGSQAETTSLETYRARMAPAAARDVPALCTNPDYVMLTAEGPLFGAGEIARSYEALGGSVTWIGKPYAAIYEAALAALGDPDPARTLCVGDSVEHDVAGGHAIGAATLLVKGGVPGVEADLAPDFTTPRFLWGANA